VEEKIVGEESSFQAFCDGKHLVSLPDTRDYKRAFNDDKGPNTGGMGSYKDIGDILPFMTKTDRAKELKVADTIFRKWVKEDKEGLRGVPLYLAFMHTGTESKILENNSRPGDPEIINILPILKDDFIDICYKILEGNLERIELEKMATVVTYKVPPNYGGYMEKYPNLVNRNQVGKAVDLTEAYELEKKYDDNLRIYPASMEVRDGETYSLKSRTISVVGIGNDIEVARKVSLDGIKKISGGGLWYRKDIASKKHIKRSIKRMAEGRLQDNS
jgi:phosphoribosylamine--glycine ligase